MPTRRPLLVLLFVLMGLGVLTGVGSAEVGTVHPVPGDFDYDLDSDLAVWRPSSGVWYVKGLLTQQWGAPTDLPVAGDYTDGYAEDLAVWRPSTGNWHVRGNGGTIVTQQWGAPTDIPVPGDYDGYFSDFAVWRPSTGNWYVTGYGGTFTSQWGAPTDIPVPGDYDGDGTTDIAVWRPSTGTWYLKDFVTVATQWGAPADIPVPGDYDGDGTDDLAVWRPSNGVWYVKGGATQQWGLPTDIPVPGDYDGDGDTDMAVWRPSNGTWYVRGGLTQQWGAPTDIPIERPAWWLAPFNDAFAGAQALGTPSGSTTGSNRYATKETGEPNHAGDAGGKSVWYQWTAPSNGQLSVNTAGSIGSHPELDTLLAVYTGTAVNALTLPGPGWENDDVDNNDLTSQVGPLPVTAGTTYRIAVDGYNGAQGTIALNWTFTP